MSVWILWIVQFCSRYRVHASWEWCHIQKEGCMVQWVLQKHIRFLFFRRSWDFLDLFTGWLLKSVPSITLLWFILWNRERVLWSWVSGRLRTGLQSFFALGFSPRGLWHCSPLTAVRRYWFFSLLVLRCTSEVGMLWSIFSGEERKNCHELCHLNNGTFQTKLGEIGKGLSGLLEPPQLSSVPWLLWQRGSPQFIANLDRQWKESRDSKKMFWRE